MSEPELKDRGACAVWYTLWGSWEVAFCDLEAEAVERAWWIDNDDQDGRQWLEGIQFTDGTTIRRSWGDERDPWPMFEALAARKERERLERIEAERLNPTPRRPTTSIPNPFRPSEPASVLSEDVPVWAASPSPNGAD